MKKFFPLLLFLVFCTSAVHARVVTGTVSSGKQKLSGVLVSDGTNFTKTNRSGKFTFSIEDDAAFVYIITPSGYAGEWSSGVPAFYQPVQDKNEFAFDLVRLQQSDTYHIIAVGDPQPRMPEQFEKFAGQPLDDMVSTAASLKNMTVGIALGDICFDRFDLMERWKPAIVKTGIPFYTAVGNHDHDREFTDDKNSIKKYREMLGPENYALFLGKDIMIVLDNIIYDGGRSNYDEGYTDAVIDWVEKLMKYVPADADIYVAQHSPLNGRLNRKMVVNYDKMLKALEGHEVLFISGHNHINGNFEYAENVREHNVSAICGTWWETYYSKDGTPSGYKVYTKADDHLTWYFKSLGHDKDYQFDVYLPGTCRLNPESFVVNVWDYDPCWRVEWYEDGVYMGIMQQVQEYCPAHEAELKAIYEPQGKMPSEYKRTVTASHYFAERPGDGTQEIMVKVTDRFGNVMTEKVLLK